MAIQAPNTNMLANPYVPSLGRETTNALAAKGMQNKIKMQENELANYEGDRAAATAAAKWEKKWKVLDKMADVEDADVASQIWANAFPEEPEAERPKISKPSKDKTKYEFPNGVVFEGTAKQYKALAAFAGKDWQLSEKPDLMVQVAQDAGLSVTRETAAGPKGKELTVDQHWDKHNQLTQDLSKYNKIDNMTAADFDNMSESAQEIIAWAGGGPGKKLDPATKARIVGEIEKKIAYHAENIPDMNKKKSNFKFMGYE